MEALVAILSDPQVWIAFFTLTALELVLGIDNIIFISILVDKLPPIERETGAPHRPVPGHVHARGPVADAVLAGGPDRAAVHGHRHGDFGPRPHPLAGRPVPGVEIHQGDPPAHRRRGRSRLGQGEGLVRGHHRADHHHRHGVLAGFHHHRRGHGGRGGRDDRRRGRVGRVDDAVRARHREFRVLASIDQDAGACPSCWWSA